MRHEPLAVAAAPKRLIICALFDKDGIIDEFVVRSLTSLRPHSDKILAVVNGSLTTQSRSRLEAVTDEILVRDNEGFDIGAQRAALEHLGASIGNFDEIILTNDTWYGPVRPWGPVFARMDACACHFWGLTDHRAVRSNPITNRRAAPYHLQSYWIAVRRPMFESERWRRYWRDLPALKTYVDAVIKHELRFTKHFATGGWVAAAAFPSEGFDTENPSLFEAESLLQSGCPILKRRPLFHWPPLLDAHGVIGSWTLESAGEMGYPTELILKNLARTVPPKAMNVDAGLMTVLPSGNDSARSAAVGPRTLVVKHTAGASLARVANSLAEIPDEYDLVVTTTDPAVAESLAPQLAESRPPRRLTEVRVVPAGASAESALLVGCHDLLVSGAHEVIVRLSSSRGGTQDLAGDCDRAHADATFLAAMVGLFAEQEGLGVVYPPSNRIGKTALSSSWRLLRPEFGRVAASLGITVPLDDVSPLAPLDGIFVARPESLRLLSSRRWTYDDFEQAPQLADVLVRMTSYAAGQLGYYTRTVVSRGCVSMSHPLLEYEVAELSSTIPGRSSDKIDFLRHSGSLGIGGGADLLKMYVRRRHSRLMHIARRLADPMRFPGRFLPRRRADN